MSILIASFSTFKSPSGYTMADSDAEAFITTTSITDDIIKEGIDNLVIDLKAGGIWTKCTAIYPFVGGDATKHSYNLKNPALYQITWNGTVTHNSNGITGNGSTGYGDTGLAANAVFTNADAHLSIYSRTNSNSTTVDIGVQGTASQLAYMLIQSGTTEIIIGNTSNNIAVANANSLGFFIATRRSTTDMEAYKNGTSIGTDVDSTAALTISSQNIYIAALNNNGTPFLRSARNTAFASIGGGLTDTEAGDYHTAVETFQDFLGRGVV